MDRLGITHVLIGIDDPQVNRTMAQLREEGIIREIQHTPERRLLYQRMRRTYRTTPVTIYQVEPGSIRALDSTKG